MSANCIVLLSVLCPGGATTNGPDATTPPAVCQNLRGGGGESWGGGVQPGVGEGGFLPGVGGGGRLAGGTMVGTDRLNVPAIDTFSH